MPDTRPRAGNVGTAEGTLDVTLDAVDRARKRFSDMAMVRIAAGFPEVVRTRPQARGPTFGKSADPDSPGPAGTTMSPATDPRTLPGPIALLDQTGVRPDHGLAGLHARKDPLVEINAVVPWEEFRPTPERAGRKPEG